MRWSMISPVAQVSRMRRQLQPPSHRNTGRKRGEHVGDIFMSQRGLVLCCCEGASDMMIK